MQTAIALLSSALTLHAAAEVQLLPAGEFKGRDGRPGNGLVWKLSDARGRALAAKLNARHASVRFNVDYEHQTMNAKENGQPAPASGWASRFEWREGKGLYALDAQWTDKARQMIERGEYRYLSPVIAYNKRTGEVSDVFNAALVNVPALDISPVARERIAQLSAQFSDEEEDAMLSEQELAVCRATGVDPQEFRAARDARQADANTSGLNEWERAVCRATGIDPEEFIATRDFQAGESMGELTEAELAVCRSTGVSVEAFIATRRQLAAAS